MKRSQDNNVDDAFGETLGAGSENVAEQATLAAGSANTMRSDSENVAEQRTLAAGSAEALASSETLAAGSAEANGEYADGESISDDLFSRLPLRSRMRYQRKGEIARGGMGRIVVVRDLELGRDIAIKELLQVNPAQERRFEREIRITSKLQHPAIIGVLEAGRWPSGEPFFTMKKVEGRPLDTVIGECKTISERLALLPSLLAVADALAYAHSVGIIHRDLKPANVLVGSFGEIVVIDWGLAKEIRSEDDAIEIEGDDENSKAGGVDDALTVMGVAMGTPAYMPPEQAQGAQVDQRADVYALGAMLYHLLAGSSPFEDSNPKSISELLRLVKERSPTRLSKIQPDLPTDLLTLIEKAMARNADERYANAGQFARDLRRFEAGQLVGAHRYSPMAMLVRWVKRHRGMVAVAAIMATLVVAVGISSMIRISEERDRADEQKQAAVASRDEVEEMLDFMLGDLHDKLEPIGKLDLLGLVTGKAIAYYAEHAVDRSLAKEVFQRAKAHRNLGRVLQGQGKFDDALHQYRASLAIMRGLPESDSRNTEWRVAQGYASVGEILRMEGDLTGSLDAYQKAKTIAESSTMPTDEGILADIYRGIGRVLLKQGKLKESLGFHRQGLEAYTLLVEQNPTDKLLLYGLNEVHKDLGNILREFGDLEGALVEYQSSLAIGARLVEDAPDNESWKNALWESHWHVGDILRLQLDYDGALKGLRLSLDGFQALTLIDPGNLQWRESLSFSHERIGEIRKAQGDLEGAKTYFTKSLELREQLVSQNPMNGTLKEILANAHNLVGEIQQAQGELESAMQHFQSALSITEELASLDRTHLQWQREVLRVNWKIGGFLLSQGDVAAAMAPFQRALDINATLLKKNPSHAVWLEDKAYSLAMLGYVYQKQNDLDSALQTFQATLETYKQLAEATPDNVIRSQNLAFAYSTVAEVRKAKGDLDEAIASQRNAVATYQKLLDENESQDAWKRSLVSAYSEIGLLLSEQGKVQKAKDAYAKAAILLEEFAKDANDYFALAGFFAQDSRIDSAFDALGKATSLGFTDLQQAKKDSSLSVLHKELRWRRFLRKLK